MELVWICTKVSEQDGNIKEKRGVRDRKIVERVG